ncbi:MAG: 4'-phosphopantetheinyl transferase superfamily protein [Bacteroidales bacterium]|nr:4'-phosphopantetheinyl transferase superfamily protein [Bacteroidales bacterium]NPV36618.1 4'-phosphopantetheinyl transferase superfamily protein [Bacteroidales bacterium]
MNELIIHCEDSSIPPAIAWNEALSHVREGIVLIAGQTDKLSPSLVDAAFALLSVDEQERAQKMRKDEQRITYIVNHAINRLFLSNLSSENPRSIRILKEPNGKPYAEPPYPFFNLSDSASFFLQGYASTPLGVDIEYIDPQMDYEPIAGRFFTLREIRHIHRSGRNWFFKYWTRKEALLKATGLGTIDSLHCMEVVTGVNILNNRCTERMALPQTGYHSIKSFLIAPFYISVASQPKTPIRGICNLSLETLSEILAR